VFSHVIFCWIQRLFKKKGFKMNEKVPYPVQVPPLITGSPQNLHSGMPPPPVQQQQQPVIVQIGMPSLSTSPQHLSMFECFLNLKWERNEISKNKLF
jgi:hypothetical protein